MRAFITVIILYISAVADNMGSMLINNYYYAGYLVIRPQDSTWADWNSDRYMVTMDSMGGLFAFYAPYLYKDKGSPLPRVRGEMKQWLSHFSSDSSLFITRPDSARASILDSLKKAGGGVITKKPIGRLRDTESINKAKDDAIDDGRLRPVEKVIAE